MTIEVLNEDIEIFGRNGISPDDLAYTINEYRKQGMSDKEIKTKMDNKLEELRSSLKEETVQNESKGLDLGKVVNYTLAIAFFSLFIFIYIFPTILANSRKVKNKSSIIFLDLCLGWTIIGWIAAFIWVHLDKSNKDK